MHFSTILSAFLGASVASAFSIRAPYPVGASCDCNGEKIVDGGRNSSAYICRDGRLGPKILPKRLPLGTVISNYDRFGGLGPEEFLEKWTDENGTYVYPPQNGFVLDDQGKPISSNVTLPKGTLVDRFGSEYGKSNTNSRFTQFARPKLIFSVGRFISAALAPYSQRALPPSNLKTNPKSPEFPNDYHVYLVTGDLLVTAGPIAPWFGQPGYGTQFFTGSRNILQLIEEGVLEKQDRSVLINSGKTCGS